jgi:SHS2 domain-containing protein
MEPHWEHFEHKADIGIRGVGRTPAEAFEQAALALTAVVAEPAAVQPLQPVSLQCAAPNVELLLVDWLNALLTEMAVRHMLFSRFEVRIADNRLDGTAWGEALDPGRHRPSVEVKGASYAALRVRSAGDKLWTVECIVDV